MGVGRRLGGCGRRLDGCGSFVPTWSCTTLHGNKINVVRNLLEKQHSYDLCTFGRISSTNTARQTQLYYAMTIGISTPTVIPCYDHWDKHRHRIWHNSAITTTI